MTHTAPTGITASEEYLGKLCRKSFLSLWSYQNVFTDRGTTPQNHQGKELCDLLVVFENDVIIFSDKSCEMPDTGDAWADWSRWFRRAIAASARQIFGAERWLKTFPERIFLDRECKAPFPLELPRPSEARFHRVVVALGASARIAAHFGGNSRGSLMLASWLRGDDHLIKGLGALPFMVGHVDPSKGFVHVFDDVTLDIVVGELDTISDFIQYLREKESLFESYPNIHCAGEEEYLGFYLSNLNRDGEFLPTVVKDALASGDRVFIAEGIWDDFLNGPLGELRAHIKEISTFIDALIEDFTHHAHSGTLEYGNEARLVTHEWNLRFLASEPRRHRAFLAEMIAQKMNVSRPRHRTSIVLPSSHPDRLYVFLLFPRVFGQSDRAYRKERQAAMIGCCYVVKFLNRDIRYVSCLATESGSPEILRSEDLLSLDFDNWTAEDNETAKSFQRRFDILTNIKPVDRFERLEFWTDEPAGNRHARRAARASKRRKA